MIEQARDFRDECEALHALLSPLDDAGLGRVTQFKGWTIADVLGHLWCWNHAAFLSLTDERSFGRLLGAVQESLGRGGGLRDFERRWLGNLSPEALRERWREDYLRTAAAYAEADPRARLRWAGPDMSARSSITARLMETWAHGQEVHDVLGVERTDADRIRNIVVLGLNTFPWTFRNRGRPVPDRVPRLRLRAPSGALWEWNADNRADVIEGSATAFCQVVTQVRHVDDTDLAVTGDLAHEWMAIAQCFAGPPEDPPPRGTRYRVAAAGR